MTVNTTDFKGLLILEPKILGDSRGYFMETYNAKVFNELGIDYQFVQDNQSKSSKGVLRGLHYQNPPYAQTKLVRVLSGVILDVVIDLRKNEPTFGKTLIVELSSENRKQLLIPKGFGHGFAVLSETAEVLYKCDEFYNPSSEGGINFLDPVIGIGSKLPALYFTLSEKDKKHPDFVNAEFDF